MVQRGRGVGPCPSGVSLGPSAEGKGIEPSDPFQGHSISSRARLTNLRRPSNSCRQVGLVTYAGRVLSRPLATMSVPAASPKVYTPTPIVQMGEAQTDFHLSSCLVPGEGVEPSRPQRAHGPEPCVSTVSPPWRGCWLLVMHPNTQTNKKLRSSLVKEHLAAWQVDHLQVRLQTSKPLNEKTPERFVYRRRLSGSYSARRLPVSPLRQTGQIRPETGRCPCAE